MAVERLDAFDKCISLFDVEYVGKGLSSLKCVTIYVNNYYSVFKFSMTGGVGGLTKVCISYCHPAVLVHLKLLFNMICLHGFVPDSLDIILSSVL